MKDYGLFNDLVDEQNTQEGGTQVAPKSQGYGIFDELVSETPQEYYQKPAPKVVVKGEITPLEVPKPTFTKFLDLSTKKRIEYGATKSFKDIYAGLQDVVASTVEGISTGKDIIKGIFTDSTIKDELANDTEFDTKVKNLANLYSSGSDATREELSTVKQSLGMTPELGFSDQLLQGVGSVIGFVGTGLATRVAATSIGFAKYASTVANAANVATESIMEAQDVYKELKKEGKSDQEAYEAFRNTLGANAVLIGLTNKFGGIFDETTYKGIKRLFKVTVAGGIEGVQEAGQQITSNFSEGKPLFDGVKDSFLIGMALGVPSAAILDSGIGAKKTEDKEELQNIIETSDATPEQKEVAQKILDGTATEEEKANVIVQTSQDPNFGIELTDEDKTAIKEDISASIEKGLDTGSITIDLQKEGIREVDAINLVAEAVFEKEKQSIIDSTIVEDVKEEKAAQKKTTADLKQDTVYENVGTLVYVTQPKTKGKKKGSVKYYFKHLDGTAKYYTEKQALELIKKGYKPAQPRVERAVPQVTDSARQYGFDNVQYYFDNTDGPEIVNYTSKDGDQVSYRTNTAMAGLPERFRNRKLFNEVEPFWYKQERPENPNNTQAGKDRQDLYDYLTKQVDDLSKQRQKDIDERMAREEKDNGIEFKKRETTASREIAVLDNFKKRYKVQFPSLIVDKIIQGQKTKLSADRAGLAEGVTDGNTIAIAFDAVANTAKHELVHLTLNNLDQIPELAKFSREDILKAQAEKMGEKFTENKAKDIEEQLALDFEAYQNLSYKPKNPILSKFFEAIRNMLKNFRSLIVKSNGDVITQYYDAVLYGETARKEEVAITTESQVTKYLIDNVIDYTPMYQTRRVLSLSNGIKSIDFKSKDDKQPEFKEALDKSLEVYKESGDLTTKILKDLEGKTTVSKQYILDATNRGDIKQVEKDLIREIVSTEGDKINVKEFADKVKGQLLPLSIKGSDLYVPNNSSFNDPDAMVQEGDFTPKYENIALPEDLRGNVENYKENIYESPVTTQAGSVHFNYLTKNYFGHTRIEDMNGDKLRRVVEVQSDLYQKGNLEKEDAVKARKFIETLTGEEKMIMNKLANDKTASFWNDLPRELFTKMRPFGLADETVYKMAKENFPDTTDVKKLEQYNDPTAHFRMIREEVRQTTQNGKDTLQFPTGETAMKIEGLGQTARWHDLANNSQLITPETLVVGKQISGNPNAREGQIWIITSVLGDGKFKAMPKEEYVKIKSTESGIMGEVTNEELNNQRSVEEFDISGKVDTNSPIYKFYEKEVGRYLKNNYAAETITDDKGVTWYEVKLKDEYKGAVVAFKERVSKETNEEYIKRRFPKYYQASRARLSPSKASRAFERAKNRLAEEYQFDVTYTTVKIADEMAKAMEVVKQNPEYAKAVALGIEEPPLDVTDTAISLAVAESAKEQGDFKLQADTEKERSLRQTRRGQEIVMERGRVDENSSSFFIKQVLDRRKELIAQKYKPFMKKAKPFNELLDEEVVKKVRKNNKIKSELEIKAADLDAFLSELAC